MDVGREWDEERKRPGSREMISNNLSLIDVGTVGVLVDRSRKIRAKISFEEF